jgi:mono/diheme cytochrome c family protein
VTNAIRFVLCGFVALAVSCAIADDASVGRGAKLYDRNCSQCHGDDLQNNTGVAFDLRRLRADDHSRFINSVTKGKRAMPSWEGALAPEQIEDIWTYVRAHAYED